MNVAIDYLITSLVLLLIGLACFVMFLFSFGKSRARVVNGYLFLAFLLFLGMGIVFASMSGIFPNTYAHSVVLWLFSIVFWIVMLLAVLGVYLLIVFFFANAWQMRKKEARTLSNSLTFLAGIALVVFLLCAVLMQSLAPPPWLQRLWVGVVGIVAFYAFHLAGFVLTLFLCLFMVPRAVQDYVIVLGCGLVNGKVSPLLARRVDAAIRFYSRQKKRKKIAPKLVMSGGQGADESCPEAVAMRNYAMGKGIPEQDILLEEKSATTLENFLFARNVMDEDAQGRHYKCIFATSSYHVLRSGAAAQQAGLPDKGIGGHTAWYYFPSALLREYIAFLWMHKTFNLMIGPAIAFLLGVLAYSTSA